jgi:hypothetical protein
VIAAVVVLATIGVGAVLFLWRSEEERVTVPDVVGLAQAEAEDAIAASGLALGDVEDVSVDTETTEADTVLSQAPSAGTEVDTGSEVALVVADVPESTIEEEGEEGAPPGGSGGGSRSDVGGSEAAPDPATKAEPGAQIDEEVWRLAAAFSGKGYYESPTFTTAANSAQVQLVATISSASGGRFRVTLGDANAVGEWSVLVISTDATATPTEHASGAVSRPPGEYGVIVQAPADGVWSYEVWQELR